MANKRQNWFDKVYEYNIKKKRIFYIHTASGYVSPNGEVKFLRVFFSNLLCYAHMNENNVYYDYLYQHYLYQ